MDKKLTLPDFLKLLTSNNVPVSKAMTIAGKVFKEYNTPALLAQLDDAKLQVLGVQDKDLRKLVLVAVRKIGHSRSNRNPKSESSNFAQPGPSGTQPLTTITPKKKRKRDDDLDELLPEAPPDEASGYGSMDFNEVLNEEVLRVKGTVINRAPLMTIWATLVAERLGFEREEALSIGSVYTEMNAVSKGVSLRIMDESRKEIDSLPGGQQPYVDIMGRRIPLYQTQLLKWRALINGSPAAPSSAFSYILRSLRQTTPYVVGALRLLAESYPPQELNKIGFSLYAEFRPTVEEWGKRGEIRCEHILCLRKKGEDTSATHTPHIQSDDRGPLEETSPSKRLRIFSSQEITFDDSDFELDEETLARLP